MACYIPRDRHQGFIAKILKPAGDDLIDVGVPIAVMVRSLGMDLMDLGRQQGRCRYLPEGGWFRSPCCYSCCSCYSRCSRRACSRCRGGGSPRCCPQGQGLRQSLGSCRGCCQEHRSQQCEGNRSQWTYYQVCPPESIQSLVRTSTSTSLPPLLLWLLLWLQWRTMVVAMKVQSTLHASQLDMSLSQMRKVIAKRLTESKVSIPHYYLSTECQMDNLLEVWGLSIYFILAPCQTQ